ncbi:hypothetical protein O181_131760 [Austropuccinia psidii MF-1]|uniref:Uncharacterized protein n=1 Tax=Austropuccinia psidii MF-1 TaxID=1389203 RepID=A0A9Q3L5Z0_9BASI|nr:hypothetical protein [Austropuccinia psidii MF-1]
MASGNHQRPPDQLSSSFPLTLRGILQFLHAPRTQGCRSHPIPSFQIKVPNSSAHFEGGFLNSSVWQSTAAIRRPFKDPNHLALQELGWQFHSGLFQGPFSEVINHFNQLSRNQVFQYSLDNSIGPYRHQSTNLYVFGPIGPIHIPLWEFSHTVQISRWPDLY